MKIKKFVFVEQAGTEKGVLRLQGQVLLVLKLMNNLQFRKAHVLAL